MASPAYLWITDHQGNAVKSHCSVKGREHAIEVFGFDHEMFIPNDQHTGVLTGTRQHGPVRVLKSFCPASPILSKACASGETLKELKFSWYRIKEDGREEEYFRHILTQVKVVSVKPKLHNIKISDNDRRTHEEEIAFRYQKIRWEYLEGNITAEDEWNIRT